MKTAMQVYIARPEQPNRNAHAHHVYAMLGLPGRSAKLPREGMEPRKLPGFPMPITVYVKPIGEATFSLTPTGRTRRRQGHRVMAICPLCGKHVGAGRLHQHVCATKDLPK